MKSINKPIVGDRCVYCGFQATCRDHVIPVCYTHIKRTNREVELVLSCTECNTIAGDKIFDSIEEKRSYIHEELKKKYKHCLTESKDGKEEWSRKELSEVRGKLKKYIMASLQMGKVIRNRLNYPDIDYDELVDMKKLLKILKL